MNASVYQGESRALQRWTIVAMLVVVTVVITATLLFEHSGLHSLRNPPWVLRLPYLFRPLAFVLGAVALYGLVQTGRRRATTRWGVVSLLLLAYLKESQAALTGYEIRDVYICGGVFGGWIFGEAVSRALDERLGRQSDPARDNAFGEAGATGVFAAVYLGAFFSKLIDTGLSWGDGASLLAVVLGRHRFSHGGDILDSYLLAVTAHPTIATVMAIATLAIQGGMVLFLVSPRLRMVMGTLVIAFHLNAFLLMGVRYIEPMILGAVFSYPWPRILRRFRAGERAVAPAPERLVADEEAPAFREVTRDAAWWVGMVGAVTLLLWIAVHWSDPSTHLLREHGFGDNHQHGSGRMDEPTDGPRSP